MTHNQFLMIVILISSCFFIGSILLEQGGLVWTMIGRGSLGGLIIALVNEILSGFGFLIPVGLNPLNVMISAILGIPGLLAIYGIGLWQILC